MISRQILVPDGREMGFESGKSLILPAIHIPPRLLGVIPPWLSPWEETVHSTSGSKVGGLDTVRQQMSTGQGGP